MLLRSLGEKCTKAELKTLRQALNLAISAHKGVRRKSGEPYILHPMEVAQIVVDEIGLGPTSATAALLHDVVEDSDFTLNDIERLFGQKTARIIDGLTKISGVFDQHSSEQAENFRKMLLTLGDDVRVILIKLADRLHNMRTMESMPQSKQLKIASETLYIYAPLAHRLGLYNLKTELEDLSLKYTEPEVYRDISMRMKAAQADEIRYLKRFSSPIKTALKTEGMDFTIKERAKSIYSIRKKMVNQGVSFEEVYDKFAIRIIIDTPVEKEKSACWKAYSVVTDFYKPNPDRLRDWISTAKSNGYESLHITVMGPEGHWVEVQIRSQRMDDNAEKGIASHWKYKDNGSADGKLEAWINKVREALENQDINALDFIDDFKYNLFNDEIFVFTPKGEIKTLPKGASPLDFSFEIHTDIGLQTLGAKVNGKLVPLNTKLKSGDQIEILTSAKQKPKEEWLNYVVTSKARTKIRSSLRDERKQMAEIGREVLARKLSFLRIKLNDQIERELTAFLKLNDSLELYYQAGLQLLDNQQLKAFARDRGRGLYGFLRSRLRRSPTTPLQPVTDPSGVRLPSKLVFGVNEQELDYKLSPCCNPIAGDDVFGFVTSNEGIKVHRTDCPNAIALQSRFAGRVIKAKWISTEVTEHTAIIDIKGIDTVGLVNKITQIISNDLNVNIRSINISGDGGMFEGAIVVMVRNRIHLQNVMNELKKIEGVQSVNRHFKSA